MKVPIGERTLDTERRQLLRGEGAVELTPKAYQLLELLVRNAPRAMSKEEIHDALWPRTFVVESNLRALVNEVRAAVGDDARQPRFVRTVYGFGYAFSAAAGAAGSAAPRPRREVVHTLAWATHEQDLAEGENVLGRDTDAAVWIGDESVSRRHARIVVTGAEAVLEDLGSKNGTFRGREKVSGAVTLASGEEIRIGEVRLTYHRVRAGGPTRTAEER